MASQSTTRTQQNNQRDDDPQRRDVPTEKKLDQLYDLIDGIEIAMMTTRAPDGSLVSRPMATQGRTEGTDLWFMTNVETAKIDELVADPHVNLGYYKDATREYVSVSGIAHVTQDKNRIRELWRPDWRAWLGDMGDDRDGSPNDPRIALIEVEAQSATYLKSDRPRPIALFSVVKGMLTGERPQVGTMAELDRRELKQGHKRD
jgi:general stress protein 26